MPTIDTTCPMCAAPHARKLSLIHSSGLSTSAGTIQTVGQFNTIGRQKITTEGTTAGVQQTEASKNAAPPVIDEITTIGTMVKIGMMLLGMASVIGGVFSGSPPFVWLGIGAIVVGVALPTIPMDSEVAQHAEKTKSQREAYERWERTFECGSCGNRFLP